MTDGSSLHAQTSTGLRGACSTIGWGLYCASSWTWCIGMFLPIILLRDFGWSAFWVFAIPNVVGCTAFGYVLNAKRSKALIQSHARPIRLFALTTVVYQIFFIGYGTSIYLFSDGSLAEDFWPVLGVVLTLCAAAAAFALRGDLFWMIFGVCAAIAAIIFYAITLSFTGGYAEASGPENGFTIAWGAPLIIIGFLLNPYLDPTFHRARQKAPSRHAFLVFGIVFSFMLAFSSLTFDPKTLGPIILPVIMGQWMIQLVYTIGANLKEIAHLPHARIGASLMFLAAVLIGTVAGLPGIADERIYLSLLGIYAVPFPLYAITAIAAGPMHPMPRFANILIIVLSLAIAPATWMGFVHLQTPWLLAAIVAMLVGGTIIGIIVRKKRIQTSISS